MNLLISRTRPFVNVCVFWGRKISLIINKFFLKKTKQELKTNNQ